MQTGTSRQLHGYDTSPDILVPFVDGRTYVVNTIMLHKLNNNIWDQDDVFNLVAQWRIKIDRSVPKQG